MLNQLSAWWFAETATIVSNHVVSVPDPNVTIARVAHPLPVEVVVRGHITGVTSTSLWAHTRRASGRSTATVSPRACARAPCSAPIVTPTTKADAGVHDEPMTCAEVVAKGFVDATLWDRVGPGPRLVRARSAPRSTAGLILADTKYEFGLGVTPGGDNDGNGDS